MVWAEKSPNPWKSPSECLYSSPLQQISVSSLFGGCLCGKRENPLLREFRAIEEQGGGVCRTAAARAGQFHFISSCSSRPKTSFNWFVNPMKTFVFFIWKRYKKYIIVLFVVALLTVFLVLLIYTMPGYISEKIING